MDCINFTCTYTDNLCIEKVSHYWLTLLVICLATYMPNFALVRVVITDIFFGLVISPFGDCYHN